MDIWLGPKCNSSMQGHKEWRKGEVSLPFLENWKKRPYFGENALKKSLDIRLY